MIGSMRGGFAAVLVCALAALALTACRQAPQAAPATSARHEVTFNRDVAPIMYEQCATCHRPANPADTTRTDAGDPICIAGAPFSLIDYRDVRSHAEDIVTATSRRLMPPWLPEQGYGDFANERRLSVEQIEAIKQWVAGGAVEGDPADKPALPSWPEGWQLGKPDLVVTMAEPYVLAPSAGDVFRTFVFPVPVSQTRYVRAIEFQTSNPRVLHHASIAVDRGRVGRRLDRNDPGPGFAAMPDDEVQNVFGWSPGKAPFMEPADRAWTLGAGSDLVAQLHMLPSGSPETVRPSIGLFFADRPPTHEPIAIALQSKAIDIPPGVSDYAIEDRYVLPVAVDLVSVYPHAHYLAKEMKATATLPEGTERPLLWIKAWNFNWQDKYQYRVPVSLPAGTTLAMRFTYDNSDGNPHNRQRPARRILWGPKSSDEMGALWLEVIPAAEPDRAVLLRDFQRRMLEADTSGGEMQVRANPRDPRARNYLATQYLQARRVDEAIVHLREALRIDPRDAEAHSNLGLAFQLQDRLEDALRETRDAARIKPNDDRLQFNLGYALQAAGRTGDAADAYARAIALNPDNVDAHFNLALILGPGGRIDDAIRHLRRAMEVSPGRADIHRNLGIALNIQGKRAEAIEEFQAALRLQPDSVEARKNLDDALGTRRAK